MCKTTHAQFAVVFSYLAALLVDMKFSIGLNFYLLIMLIPLIARKGALFPDYDQNWNSISERTTISWLFNKLIYTTGGRHRSKHTHSWDICLVSLAILYISIDILGEKAIFSQLDVGVAHILLFGFYSGWASHLLSDMFNGEGVWLSVFSKKKIAFVPKKLFGIRFNTGGAWERFFYKTSCFLSKVLGIICLIYPIAKSGVLLSFISGI